MPMQKIITRKSQEEFLLHHDFEKAQLQIMNSQEIKEQYESVTRKSIYAFMQATMDDNGVKGIDTSGIIDVEQVNAYKERLREVIEDSVEIIKVLLEGYEVFSYAEVNDLFESVSRHLPAHRMQKIFRTAYRQYQEILLAKIQESLKELPDEENKMLVEHYEENRENIILLQDTLKKLDDPLTREQLLATSRTKLLIVQLFLPNILTETYDKYFNNTPQKLELVGKIMSLTGLYTKDQLKVLPIEQLQEIHEEILEHNRQEEEDKKVFLKYSQAISEAMFNNDDDTFSEVCSIAVTHLTTTQLQMLVEYMSNQNPLFTAKFETIMHEYKKKMNFKR